MNLKLAKIGLPLALLVMLSFRAEADYDTCRSNVAVGNLLTDVIVVRPVGLIGTLVGGGLFMGLSPLIAIANITPPHNAFERVSAVLIGVPYNYTFVRPLGYFPSSCN